MLLAVVGTTRLAWNSDDEAGIGCVDGAELLAAEDTGRLRLMLDWAVVDATMLRLCILDALATGETKFVLLVAA